MWQSGTVPNLSQGYNPQAPGWTQPLPTPATTPLAQVPTSSRGVPIWAWLLPLLVVMAVGGYFGFAAYQNNENEKRVLAGGVATAQAESTARAFAQATETAATNETAIAVADVNATATALTEAANTNATATAVADANATSTAVANANATSTTLAERQAEEVNTHATESAVAVQAAADATSTAITKIPINPEGTIDSIKVDYDVMESGEKGMRIHFHMTADGLKGVPCEATVYFYYKNGDHVKDTDGDYNTTDGQASAGEQFNPGFDNTVYDDFQVFMPYSQIEIPPGHYDLQFDIQAYVIEPYNLLATSDYVDFTFDK
jgi:hypothetical protein